jgi:hypothetical protein
MYSAAMAVALTPFLANYGMVVDMDGNRGGGDQYVTFYVKLYN